MKYFYILLTAIILGGLSRPSVAQPTADTLSYYEQYQQELSGLASEFNKYGFNLNSLIDDDRFEVYGDIDNRFKGSAERTTPTLEEYKAILDFEEKVEQGAQFLKKHSLQLQEAAKKYGVSKYI